MKIKLAQLEEKLFFNCTTISVKQRYLLIIWSWDRSLIHNQSNTVHVTLAIGNIFFPKAYIITAAQIPFVERSRNEANTFEQHRKRSSFLIMSQSYLHAISTSSCTLWTNSEKEWYKKLKCW